MDPLPLLLVDARRPAGRRAAIGERLGEGAVRHASTDRTAGRSGARNSGRGPR